MRKLWVNVDKDWQKGALVQITQLPLGGTKHGVGGQLPRLPRHQPVHNQPGVHHTRTQPLKTLLHHALKVRERTVLKQRLHKVRRRGFQSLRVVECTWTPQSSLWHKPLLTFVLYCCFALCFFLASPLLIGEPLLLALLLFSWYCITDTMYQCSVKTRERYWEIHPRCPGDFPRLERFPEGETRGTL